jgi:regulator of protease activity HflC (stomatin/prohibitin superfamily)
MKNFQKILLLVFVTVAIVFMTGCNKVIQPGYEGIKVVKTGTSKGVQNAPIVTGRVWYNPITTDIIEYPLFTQVVTWTKSETEESPNDDSITFNSVQGACINADISFAYRIKQGYTGRIYMMYHCQDIKDLTWRYMRVKVRDVVTNEAAKMKTIDIIGIRKQEMLDLAKVQLAKQLDPQGFIIDTLAFVGEMRPSEGVKSSINAVIQAEQAAIAADKKIMTARAEAQQVVEKAEGELKAAKLRAEANIALQKSLTPDFLKYQALMKWNGVLPTVTSGAVPFIDIKQQ